MGRPYRNRVFAAWLLAGLTVPGWAFCAADAPKQVIVSVKIIEFQASKGVDTGFSAYFKRTVKKRPFGEVSSVNTADLTFPTGTAAGLTVFLDKITFHEGAIEVVLQALVDENKAFILSKPRAMVMVGEARPTVIQTTQQIPYENTVVVGSTAVQVTAFEDTGVSLEISVPEVTDDDGNWTTRHDSYIRLDVRASVKEEGQRIVVALDDQLAGGGAFSDANNAITVPEFVSRSIDTHVWVGDGQVLMLGGLYSNRETRSITTVPWLPRADDLITGAFDQAVGSSFGVSPLSATFGNRDTTESRRELVFLIKSEIWRPSFTLSDEYGFRGVREPAGAPPAEATVDVIGSEETSE